MNCGSGLRRGLCRRIDGLYSDHPIFKICIWMTAMRFDSLLIEISATPLYAFCLFFAMLVIMHFLLIFWKNLDEITWKHVDYIWLGAAVLGLIGTSMQSERFISKPYLETFEKPRTEIAYTYLRSLLADHPGICMPRVRSEYSPPNFDEILLEQNRLCKRLDMIVNRMPVSFSGSYPSLNKTGYEPIGTRNQYKYHLYFLKDVEDRAEEYRRQQRRYADFVNSTKISDSEALLLILSPLLLSFALALRITKVTAEIHIAKKKKMQPEPHPISVKIEEIKNCDIAHP